MNFISEIFDLIGEIFISLLKMPVLILRKLGVLKNNNKINNSGEGGHEEGEHE